MKIDGVELQTGDTYFEYVSEDGAVNGVWSCRIVTLTVWRYWWQRLAGWFPIQWCHVCRGPYWGGLPRPGWQASYQDYCSRECADVELDGTDPPVRHWLARWLDRTFPWMDIKGTDGTVYLRRYFLTPKNWPFRLYLHEFFRGDNDRCLHDHPAPFVTWVLNGGYREVLSDKGDYRDWPPGTMLYRKAAFAHRIEVPRGRKAWSLVLFGPRERDWGFHTRKGWRKFIPGSWGNVCEGA